MKKRFLGAALALSVAAGSIGFMSVSAADAEVLLSDNFDGYTNITEKINDDIGDTLVHSQASSETFTRIDGMTLYTCPRSSGDDSSYYQIKDRKGSDKYIMTTISRFSNQGRGAYIKFNDTYAPEEGKDLVVSFDVKFDPASADSGLTFMSEMVIENLAVNAAGAGIKEGEWATFKYVIKADGTSVLYVNDKETLKGTDTQLSTIRFMDTGAMGDAEKSATHRLGYPTVSMDNLVVYKTADGAKDATPKAEKKEILPEATPSPEPTATPEPTQAPTAAPTEAPTEAPTKAPAAQPGEGQVLTTFNSVASDWAAAELEDAYKENLVPEVLVAEDLTKDVTRAEFAAIAVKLYENLSAKTAEPAAENPFTDITKSTCREEILKAYALNITMGTTDTEFEPEELISREQVAAMLTRAYKKAAFPEWTLEKDADYPVKASAEVAPFADDAMISDYAKEAVYFMAGSGIINGVGDNNFAPYKTEGSEEGNATREQALAIALRSVKNL